MNAEMMVKKLIEEKHYDKVQTERLIPKIDALPEEIKTALVHWMKSGEVSSPEYSGYTVDRILREKPGMTTLAAYLALDWIRKDPKTAIKAIVAPVIKYIPTEKK